MKVPNAALFLKATDPIQDLEALTIAWGIAIDRNDIAGLNQIAAKMMREADKTKGTAQQRLAERMIAAAVRQLGPDTDIVFSKTDIRKACAAQLPSSAEIIHLLPKAAA